MRRVIKDSVLFFQIMKATPKKLRMKSHGYSHFAKRFPTFNLESWAWIIFWKEVGNQKKEND